jgi:hypothetical protein
MSRPLLTLLVALALTACGDSGTTTAVAADVVVATVAVAAPVQTPAPATAPTTNPTPCRPTDTACKVLFCQPVGYCPPNVITEPAPTPAPLPVPIVEADPAPDYSDCRCNSAGVLICTEPNPPYYIFCPSPPRANPAPCIYECNNESGPVTY